MSDDDAEVRAAFRTLLSAERAGYKQTRDCARQHPRVLLGGHR